jgi:hypothetical protein
MQSRKWSRTERKRLRFSGNVALDCFAALAKTGTFAFFQQPDRTHSAQRTVRRKTRLKLLREPFCVTFEPSIAGGSSSGPDATFGLLREPCDKHLVGFVRVSCLPLPARLQETAHACAVGNTGLTRKPVKHVQDQQGPRLDP